MNTAEFTRIYNESRNGANEFFRHGPLMRNLIYSDGVKDLAECGGCYWLLDIIGTEVVQAMRKAESMGIFKATVANGQADLRLSLADDAPPAWKRHINFTDMPDGEWTFYINKEGGSTCYLVLPTEY